MSESVDRPRVAVVVPTYNSGPYLRETLESVLGQTYPGWEAIVIDDASSDPATHAVAREFAARDARFRAIRLERNVGVAAARNAAIETSRSELVALLDHDDRLLPDYLERSLAAFDRRAGSGTRVGIVAPNALIEAPGAPSGQTFAERFGWADPVDYDAMITRNCICARAVFSRAAYDEVGGFSSQCPGYDDYDMWLRMIEAGYEVVPVLEPIAVYRIHEAAQSADPLMMAEGAVASHRRALARGAITGRQRRALRARIRHNRALREYALARRAAAEGRRPVALARALRTVPFGVVAFAQAPSRWREWLGGQRSERTRS